MPEVAVVGGSLGGLTAALLLRDAGCEVTVHERSPTTLEARGAGIAVLDQTLRYPVERLGLAADEISTRTQWVRFLGTDGSTAYAEQRSYRFSAWNTIYRVLHEAFPTDRYRLGREMTSFASHEHGVELTFADGDTCEADLLVCADGISSTSRRQLFPAVTPRYAGYVGWRGTVPEAELSGSTYEALHDAITYQVLPHSHILVYSPTATDHAASSPCPRAWCATSRSRSSDGSRRSTSRRQSRRRSARWPSRSCRRSSTSTSPG
jgi:2,6-dihydroxypyridine 3-monooxygenase